MVLLATVLVLSVLVKFMDVLHDRSTSICNASDRFTDPCVLIEFSELAVACIFFWQMAIAAPFIMPIAVASCSVVSMSGCASRNLMHAHARSRQTHDFVLFWKVSAFT